MINPETSFSPPSLINGSSLPQSHAHGLALPTGGAPFLTGAHSGRQASAEYDWPTPDQQLAAITEFIDTTTRLSAIELRWLAFMETWNRPAKPLEPNEQLSPFQQSKLDKQLNLTTEIGNRTVENGRILGEAIMQLTRQGNPVKIRHPRTGQSVPILGLFYSNDQLGYLAAIPEPAPMPPQLIPLFTPDQLHL